MNEELRLIYDADQADRTSDEMPPDLEHRDRERLRRVEELLAAGVAQAPDDLYHAAMVFQHGDGPAHFQRAHELARRAAESGYERARWLAAAAEDRWLTSQGRPQRFGTQYRASAGGWELQEVDPSTTDEERARWDVPSLAEARRRAEEMNTSGPAPPKLTLPSFQVLTSCRAGDLELQVIAMPEGMPEHPPQPPEPCSIDDVDPRLWLPEGLSVARVGGGFIFQDASAATVLTLIRMPAGLPAVVVWPHKNRPPSDPEPAEVSGRPAIWWAVDPSQPFLLVRTSRSDTWLLGGGLPRDELRRVAASLV